MKIPLLCCLATGAPVFPALADYRDDTGFFQLQTELGVALPDGTGVGITQVEAKLPSPPFSENSYLPQSTDVTPFAGVGIYSGKEFTAKSGTGPGSFHAAEVGTLIYGMDGTGGTSPPSLAPGIASIDCWDSNSYTTEFLSPSGLEPLAEIRAAQCHAWIYDSAGPAQAPQIIDLVRRMDYSINRDNYVSAVGLNNGPASIVPDLWASGYNVISVGLTNGAHSRGGVTSDMDGPGRRKPEIVAPLTATSHATGFVTGAAALLRQKANLIGTTNARRNKTLKAILLAGATKEEFPGWSKTTLHPIDAVYGAGELNIYNSYQIMNGGEQPAGQTTSRPYMAWDYHSLTSNGSTEYRLNIPSGQYGAELSAFIVWHRTPSDTNASASIFTPGNDPLVNFDLTLLRYPAAGGAAVTIDSSASTLYNIEHVWKTSLPAGNYSLRVNRSTGTSHDFAIAWRVTVRPHQPQPVITASGGNFVFTFSDLIAGQPYKFQSSPDLAVWTDLESFTATTAATTRTLPQPTGTRLYYRLLPVLP